MRPENLVFSALTKPTLPTLSQLRQDLSDARRRAALAANAETQAGIAVALHREKHAEAARLRRELLVRRTPLCFFLSLRAFQKLESDPSRNLRLAPTSQNSLQDARNEICKLNIQVNAQASLLNLQRALATSPTPRRDSFSPIASPASATQRDGENSPNVSFTEIDLESPRPSPDPASVSSNEALDIPLRVSPTRAHATAVRTNANTDTEEANSIAMPPPAFRPRVNLRGFAGGGAVDAENVSPPVAAASRSPPTEPQITQTTTPSSQDTSVDVHITSMPRRALRERTRNVVYTEPSLKTKMRRPAGVKSEVDRFDDASIQTRNENTTEPDAAATTFPVATRFLEVFVDRHDASTRNEDTTLPDVAATAADTMFPVETHFLEVDVGVGAGELAATRGDSPVPIEPTLASLVGVSPFSVSPQAFETEQDEWEHSHSTPLAFVTHRHRRRLGRGFCESPETPVDVPGVEDDEVVTPNDELLTPPSDELLTSESDDGSPSPNGSNDSSLRVQIDSDSRSLSFPSSEKQNSASAVSSFHDSELVQFDGDGDVTEIASPPNQRLHPRRLSASVPTYLEPSVNRQMRQ